MTNYVAAGAAFATAVSLMGCAHAGGLPKDPRYDSAGTRLAAIRQARVWSRTDIASMDLKAGPPDKGAFAPNASVTCDYMEKKASGRSPKFACVIPPADELKVKFGPGNGEVYAEVAASRLLWALGFGADHLYPVQVVCRGCPSKIKGTHVASIQRKMHGREIETAADSGWTWPELDLVDPAAKGAPQDERSALKLLAAFIQHTDSKAAQQRLLCVSDDGKRERGTPCAETFMMVHDLGQTFGHANLFNRDSVSSVNLRQWSDTPVWKDPARCVANLSKSMTGSLKNPLITEGGRRFLADLLAQLTDAQLHDLFDVARFMQRSTAAPRPSADATTTAQWVEAFKAKRDQIVHHTCPGIGAVGAVPVSLSAQLR